MKNALKYINLAFSFGISSAVAVYLGYLGGSWVDHRLGTYPIFTFIGILLGIISSFRILIREVLGSETERSPGEKDDEE